MRSVARKLFLIKKLKTRLYLKILKMNGLRLGRGCNIFDNVSIDFDFCQHIIIGNNVTIAKNVSILAHDASTKIAMGVTLVGKVKIGDNVFIGTGSIILPNVIIGSNCIIGAFSVVTKDVPNNVVIAGNPARVLCSLANFIEKHKERRLQLQDNYIE